MKRIVVLFLITGFLLSMWGCVAKSKHEELFEQKAALERKCEELSRKQEELKGDIAARIKEIDGLRKELRDAKIKINELDKELLKTKGPETNIE